MRKPLLIALCMSMSYFLMAQETTKRKEVGLTFSSLDSFGLTYRTGTEKSLWRFNTLLISGGNNDNTSDSLVNKQSDVDFGFKVGREYRKKLDDKFELRYGADLSFSYHERELDVDDKTIDNRDRFYERKTYGAGVNLVFGFNYVINKNIVLGAELLPSFGYFSGTTVEKNDYSNNGEEYESDTSGIQYGLSNSSALLSIVYRF